MEDPRNLWQTQEVEEMKFSVEGLRAKAAKFQRRISWRNLREYLAALIVIALFGWNCWKETLLLPRIAFLMLIAASIYYMWHLHRWGSARPLPADAGSTSCVSFYRHELERQRDLVRNVWRWALLPLVPGLVLLDAYFIANTQPSARWHLVGAILFEAAAFIGVLWLNLRSARCLNRRIAELDRELGRV